MTDPLEKILLMDLIRSARSNPEKAKALFGDTVKDLIKAIELKDHEMLQTIVTIALNMLPKETAKDIQERNNLKMANGLLEEFKAFVESDLLVFTHEVPPCDCPVCRQNDRKVHLAN